MYLDLYKDFRVERFGADKLWKTLFRVLSSAKENKPFDINYAHSFPVAT